MSQIRIQNYKPTTYINKTQTPQTTPQLNIKNTPTSIIQSIVKQIHKVNISLNHITFLNDFLFDHLIIHLFLPSVIDKQGSDKKKILSKQIAIIKYHQFKPENQKMVYDLNYSQQFEIQLETKEQYQQQYENPVRLLIHPKIFNLRTEPTICDLWIKKHQSEYDNHKKYQKLNIATELATFELGYNFSVFDNLNRSNQIDSYVKRISSNSTNRNNRKQRNGSNKIQLSYSGNKQLYTTTNGFSKSIQKTQKYRNQQQRFMQTGCLHEKRNINKQDANISNKRQVNINNQNCSICDKFEMDIQKTLISKQQKEVNNRKQEQMIRFKKQNASLRKQLALLKSKQLQQTQLLSQQINEIEKRSFKVIHENLKQKKKQLNLKNEWEIQKMQLMHKVIHLRQLLRNIQD